MYSPPLIHYTSVTFCGRMCLPHTPLSLLFKSSCEYIYLHDKFCICKHCCLNELRHSMAFWLNNQSQDFAKELAEGSSLFYTHTQEQPKSKKLSSLSILYSSSQHASWSQWHSMAPLATTSSSKSSSSGFFLGTGV